MENFADNSFINIDELKKQNKLWKSGNEKEEIIEMT